MHTQWTQIQEQFERLMDLPTEQQLSALEKLALSQPEIVDELKSLLSIDQRPHNLMEEGIKLALSPDTRIGDQSGPYRIQTHLGSGGMGSVYQAERVEGEFQQQVALKVVQKGLLSDQLLPQFQAERQILARLQHPHIARLYDGGISETGEPYFTMELVDGLPLTDYAGQQQLDEKGKLRLFLQVCEAMQYAHRQLIVHLDLKPGNMLVDANGQVKLLDFGVSRLVQQEQESTGSSGLTRAYASPEQLAGEMISTQSDIYSLGIVLYELLFEERLDPSVPRSGKPQDLSLIIQKATQKAAKNRYETVEAMAEDIEAYLDQRPISLRDESVYRLQKYYQRNRVVLSLAVLAGLILLGTIGFYTARLTKERNLAQAEAAKSQQVLAMMKKVFLAVDPEAAPGEKLSADEFLGRALPKLNEFLAEEPEAKADLLSFWGYLYRNQAQYERSDSLFASAASIYDSLPEAPVRERIFNLREWSNTMFYAGKLDEADSLLQIAGDLLPAKGLDRDTTLASLHRSRGDIAYEMGAYDQADSLYQLAYDWHHDQGEDSLDLAIAIHSLGMTARKRSDFAEADSLFRLSLTIKRSILEEPHSEIAYTLNYLASLAWDQGFHEKSKAYAAASLRQRKAIFVPHHPEVMASMGNYARSLMKLEQFDSAKVMYEQMSVSVEKSFGTKEHPYYAMLQQNQAACLLYTKRYEEAEAAYVALGPLYQKVFPAGHLQHATYNLRLGEVKLKQGAFREAVPYLQESLNLREEKRGKESREYADVAYLLGQCYDGLSQTQKARPYLEQALAVFRSTPLRYENSIAKIETMLEE